ncbi:hypothetical protein X777_12633 [Ooceraea biroi]|uniref:Mutator-like transposase domain-containing protein n=1 Tax=Ooceraea biroi TaxID=2015173 RepID=A0A026VZ66_OOCBI|nr:hypothetical protein X777_12633 [Ooceraea biroi]
MAGEEEKQLAIERNETINGIPYITVVADGSWMKRSYGSAYDSPSGVGTIIGYRTGKVLFVGVRNKYCVLCDMAEQRGVEVRKHKCYKNFDSNASSTRMESDAIVEGFKSNLEMHGLIYKTLVADGDSSVYNSIRHNAPYHDMNIVVRKVEYTNHLLYNLCKKLKTVARTTVPKAMMHRKRDFVQLRNVVDHNILAMRKEILRVAAVRNQETQAHHMKAKELLEDILNIPSHIFGEHKRCRERGVHQDLCNNKKNYVPSLKHCGLFQQIYSAVKWLSTYSDSLLLNVTNNPAESFNSIICKEIGGKRIHFGKRGSYNVRIAGSVVQYNTQVLTQIHENMCKDVPAVVADLENRQLKVARNKECRKVHGRKRFKRDAGPDSHYGPHSQKPDLPPHVFEQLQQHHAEKLLENANNRDEIECQTSGQSDCELWQSLRREMLTASNFGIVCRLRQTTPCAATVKSILFPLSLETAAMKYGRDMEGIARKEIAEKLKKDIPSCGLFIDEGNPCLGASLTVLLMKTVLSRLNVLCQLKI